MTGMDEFRVLTYAIGEYTVDALGKENLSGLQVVTNLREMSALITIALKDKSNEAQRWAIARMFDIEEMYADEIELTYIFVDTLHHTPEASSSVPQYSYA